MRILRGVVPALVVVTLVTAACGGDPEVTAPPSATPSPTPDAHAGDHRDPVRGGRVPGVRLGVRRGRLRRAGWAGSRRSTPGPCGSSCARPTPPSSPGSPIPSPACSTRPRSRSLARGPGRPPHARGHGPLRRRPLGAGRERAALARAAPEAAPDAVSPVIVVAWDPDAAARTAALEDATIDGIDAPGPAELDQIATLPELVVTHRAGPRDGVPRASGPGRPSRAPQVRRAIAGSLDRGALVTAAFPAGHAPSRPTSRRASSTAPARGPRWYEFNAPGRRRVARRPRRSTSSGPYPLHVPDAPVPGLPDPGGRRGGREGPARDEPRPQGQRSTSCPRRSSATAVDKGIAQQPLPRRRRLAARRRRRVPRAAVRRRACDRRPRGARPASSGALERAAAETDAEAAGGDHRRGQHGDPRTRRRRAARAPRLDRRRSAATSRACVTSPLGARPARRRDARRPAAARVRAGDRARAGRGAATSRRSDAFRLCGLLADGPVRLRARQRDTGAAPRAGVHARTTDATGVDLHAARAT